MFDFNTIVGHEQIIEHLQNAIKLNKVSHAYIFNGEKGMGKKLLANTFAKTLQCTTESINPCGTCTSCLQMDSGNHPDIIYVTHEKASIGVDDIRTQINQDIGIKPYSSKYKIYIVDGSDLMTEQAQNALLKTIEEPPPYGIIILLTENVGKFLPTIFSRCITLNLKPISGDAIKKQLIQEYNIPENEAEISGAFCQGNMGRAIRYASSDEFLKVKGEVLHLLKYIDDMEIYEVIDAMKSMSEDKLEINDYIDLMILWYRDVLMFKVTKNPNLLLHKDEFKYISKQANTRDYEGIENIINAMDKAKTRLKANVNFEIAIELMLLTLKENGHD